MWPDKRVDIWFSPSKTEERQCLLEIRLKDSIMRQIKVLKRMPSSLVCSFWCVYSSEAMHPLLQERHTSGRVISSSVWQASLLSSALEDRYQQVLAL